MSLAVLLPEECSDPPLTLPSAAELQRDEEEAAALGAARRPSAAPSVAPPAGPDPELSTNHPFYDVARHGILQVAGESLRGGWSLGALLRQPS